MVSVNIYRVYQNLLKNDIAIMRCNFPATYTANFSDSEIYLSQGLPTVASASRSMDLLVVISAILVGLSDQFQKGGIRQVISALRSLRDELYNNLRDYYKPFFSDFATQAKSDVERLSAELANVIQLLILNGLLHVIPKKYSVDKSESIRPLCALNKIVKSSVNIKSSSLNVLKVSIGSISQFNDVVALMSILRKLSALKINLDLSILHEIAFRVIAYLKQWMQSSWKSIACTDPQCENIFFKTAHGELIRLVGFSGALPDILATYEQLVLPFLEEPLADYKITIDLLKQDLEKFFNNVSQKIDPNIIVSIILKSFKNTGISKLSQYQLTMIREMLRMDPPILSLVSAPTGSGKTIVFTLYLISWIIREKLLDSKRKVVLIYPRKSLARSQIERLLSLVYELNSEMKRVGLQEIKILIRDGDSLETSGISTTSFTSLRSVKIRDMDLVHRYDPNRGIYEVGLRRGRNIYNIYWVYDIKDEGYIDSADIIITNMNMLSKLTTDAISELIANNGGHLSRNLSRIGLLVVDEAHVYLMANLIDFTYHTLMRLLFLKICSRYGDIEKILNEDVNNLIKSISNDLPDIIISSATISNRQILPNNVATQFITGIKRKTRRRPTNPPQDLLNYTMSLLGRFFKAYENKITYSDYYYEQRNSKNWRLIVPVIVFSTPDRLGHTAFLETYIIFLHWIMGLRFRSKIFEKSTMLGFIDNKTTLNDLVSYVYRRHIYDAKELADKVFLTFKYPYYGIHRKHRDKAVDLIQTPMEESFNSGESLLDVIISNDELFEYSLVHFYIPLHLLSKIKSFDDINNDQIYSKIIPQIDSLDGLSQKILSSGQPISETLSNLLSQQIVPLVDHHADLQKQERIIREGALSDGKVMSAFSTSTLELGVDINSLLGVMQFGSRITKDSFNQRIGRSGRSPQTLYVSFGLLVLRNTGEDVHLISEPTAVDFVYNLEIPKIPLPQSNFTENIRYLAMIAFEVFHNHGGISARLLPRVTSFLRSLSKLTYQGSLNKLEERLENLVTNIMDILSRHSSTRGLTHNQIQNELLNAKKSFDSAFTTFKQSVIIEFQRVSRILSSVSIPLHHKIRGYITSIFHKLANIDIMLSRTLNNEALLPIIRLISETIIMMWDLYYELYDMLNYANRQHEIRMIENIQHAISQSRNSIYQAYFTLASIYVSFIKTFLDRLLLTTRQISSTRPAQPILLACISCLDSNKVRKMRREIEDKLLREIMIYRIPHPAIVKKSTAYILVSSADSHQDTTCQCRSSDEKSMLRLLIPLKSFR